MKNKINNLLIYLFVLVAIIIVTFVNVYFYSWSLLMVPIMIAAFIIFMLILRNPYWGFLLLIFVLPFERIPSIDIGLVTLKMNQLVGAITLLSWFGVMVFKKYRIMPNILTWPIIIFILINFLSLFQAGNLNRALQVFVFTVFMIFISIMTVNMVQTKESLSKIITLLFWSTFVVCIFAFYQFFADLIGLPTSLSGLREGYTKAVFGFPRVMAFSNEPLYLADFLFIPIGVTLALFLNKVKFIKLVYLFILLAMMLLVFILTVSRGAYLGLAAMGLFFAIFMFKRIFSWKNILIGIVIGAIVIGGVLYFLSKSESQAYDEFMKHIRVEDVTAGESVNGRLTTYQEAYQIWQKYPLLGIGLGNYGPYVKGFPDASQVSGWDIVNNEYLEIMTETGILGIIAFGLILLVLFWRFIIAYLKNKDPLLGAIHLGLIGALVGILVQYNFFSTLYIMHIWVLIGLIVAVQNLIFISPENNKK